MVTSEINPLEMSTLEFRHHLIKEAKKKMDVVNYSEVIKNSFAFLKENNQGRELFNATPTIVMDRIREFGHLLPNNETEWSDYQKKVLYLDL